MAAPHQRSYSRSTEEVIDAALRALTQMRYKIDNVDRQNGIINFKTGMSIFSWGQELSVVITSNGNNTNVDIGNKLKFGVVDWGESSRLRSKIFDLIERNLSAL